MARERVYRAVSEPLLHGKLGDLVEEVAAVWLWNKLRLRGGSRGRGGGERLACYRGGFAADALWRLSDEEAIAFTLAHLRRMFPDLMDDRILAAHVWRAQYAQPVVDLGYRRLIPATRTPVTNLFLVTMDEIYPQDRGTNHAIRQGREVARTSAATLDGAG